ncbi:hypothetical protein [Deinococcus aquiradiocola]|uniref:Uncharacterized protein n=1 Tax=Deinococcus aquiradiocola TaxID=393059 RepID=A0A917P790_9DEIO|nr:hypothetical protein [Deinococcus aquiradiocola]GGJ65141.1 hypothetical protein GCM10008939_06300 [Deinococcus aquiradiocola]
MPALRDTIAALFGRAATAPADATVTRGLHLRARVVDGQRQLLLSRRDARPSDAEVRTCAQHGDFTTYEVTGGPRWQLITDLGHAAPPAPVAPTPGRTCGTCAHATPTPYPNEVECTLGWDRHDGTLRPTLTGTPAWVPVPQGHGGLPLPVLHPAHRCTAVIGGNRPGWTARP